MLYLYSLFNILLFFLAFSLLFLYFNSFRLLLVFTFSSSKPIFKPKNTSVREGQKLYSIRKGNKFLLCHADVNGAMNIAKKVILAFNIETIKTSDKSSQIKKIKKIYNYRIVALSNHSVKGSLFTELKP